MDSDKSIRKILQTDTERLGIEGELKNFMREHGFENLEALLEYGVPDLNKMEGFTPQTLYKLQKLLDECGVLHLLSQWPRKR